MQSMNLSSHFELQQWPLSISKKEKIKLYLTEG